MRLVTLLLFVCLLLACGDDETTPQVPIFLPGPMTYGYADMEKNGEPMTASSQGFKAQIVIDTNLLSITFSTYDTFGNVRESLAFGYFPFEFGQYTFPFGEFAPYMYQSYITLLDHTEIEDRYDMDETFSNVLSITEVDTVANILKGTFEARYIVRQPKVNPANPDVVTFTNGIFDTSFEN